MKITKKRKSAQKAEKRLKKLKKSDLSLAKLISEMEYSKQIEKSIDVDSRNEASEEILDKDLKEMVPSFHAKTTSFAKRKGSKIDNQPFKSRILFICRDCQRPLFGDKLQSENDVCECQPQMSIGVFWQEPHPSRKDSIQTVALYETGKRSIAATLRSKKGPKFSKVQMTVRLPQGKVILDPIGSAINLNSVKYRSPRFR